MNQHSLSPTSRTPSGQLKWIREVTNDGAIAGHVGPIGLGGEAVFIATVAKAGGPTISAFHLETGSPLWRTSTIVALTSERGFTIGGDKTYLMGEQGGLPVLLKVDALTGRIDAEFKFR